MPQHLKLLPGPWIAVAKGTAKHRASLITGGQPSTSSTHEFQNHTYLKQPQKYQNTLGRHRCTIRTMHKPREIFFTSYTKNKLHGLYRRDPRSPQPRHSTPPHDQWPALHASSHPTANAVGETLWPTSGSRLNMSQGCAKQVAFTGLLTPKQWLSLLWGRLRVLDQVVSPSRNNFCTCYKAPFEICSSWKYLLRAVLWTVLKTMEMVQGPLGLASWTCLLPPHHTARWKIYQSREQ